LKNLKLDQDPNIPLTFSEKILKSFANESEDDDFYE
jgi:hypothetical protein